MWGTDYHAGEWVESVGGMTSNKINPCFRGFDWDRFTFPRACKHCTLTTCFFFHQLQFIQEHDLLALALGGAFTHMSLPFKCNPLDGSLTNETIRKEHLNELQLRKK
jgi:hypothetical protein